MQAVTPRWDGNVQPTLDWGGLFKLLSETLVLFKPQEIMAHGEMSGGDPCIRLSLE